MSHSFTKVCVLYRLSGWKRITKLLHTKPTLFINMTIIAESKDLPKGKRQKLLRLEYPKTFVTVEKYELAKLVSEFSDAFMN